MDKIIQRGAEAVIIRKGSEVLKKRVAKGYRLKELDGAIRKRRTRREGKLLKRAGKLISVPGVSRVDEGVGEIDMEFIQGEKLSESLDGLKNWKEVCLEIGKNIAKLHDADIIHGDLTTSNMILKNKDVYFIDFGLGFTSSRIEDKAVDLHLIKRALEAKHLEKWAEFFGEILRGYKISENYEKVLRQFEKVGGRGRYKE